MNDIITKYLTTTKLPKRLPKSESEEFKKIIHEINSQYDLSISTNRELLYVIEQNITSPPTCANCTKATKWVPSKKAYANCCSLACAAAVKDWKWSDQTPEAKASIIAARKKTNLVRYGSTNFLASAAGKQAITESLTNKYGAGVTNPSHIPGMTEKKEQNAMKLYGVTNKNKLEASKIKRRQTNNLRYKRDSWSQRHLSPATISKLNDGDWMREQHITNKRSLANLSIELDNMDSSAIGRYLTDHGIDIIRHNTTRSSQEVRVCNLLDRLGVDYITNDRTVISPKELDIFIPNLNVAIEICGTYWHGDWRLPRSYHADKQSQCADNGITLLTIWDTEIDNKWTVVEKKLTHLLSSSSEKRYNGRSLLIKELTKQQSKALLENNHIQGDGPGSIRVGLFDDVDGLVAVMVFIRKKEHLVLNRYTTDGIVRGGFTKLLKHIQRQYNLPIHTFADLRWGTGEMYTDSGFTLVDTQPPNYSYVVNNTIYHRSCFRLRYLPNRLANFDPSLTEFQNCDNNNIIRLWDCGLVKFILEPL